MKIGSANGEELFIENWQKLSNMLDIFLTATNEQFLTKN